MATTWRKQAEDLVKRMTLKEMFSQLRHDAPSIPRLGIEAYNWWNEGLHGAARSGTATVFPQAIALASLFDAAFLEKIADIISTEQRAKYNLFSSLGDRDIYKGLSVWSPNVNIFRDPRWGRGQETFGEDPHLSSMLATAFIKGLQGDEEKLKCAACVKHFVAHSGPESLRHGFNAVVSKKDLTETYTPAFKAAVQHGKVNAVMGAYSAVNGEPSCGSKTLITDVLRKDWGFEGMYISDCWAIRDFHLNHKVTKNDEESVALALNAGCDLNCGCEFEYLEKAYQKHLIERQTVQEACIRVMQTRFQLGMFGQGTAYDHLGFSDIDNDEHAYIAFEAACRSLVLLKNDHLLPLDLHELSSIAVIGPNANSERALWGNYHGTSSRNVTILEGIRAYVGTKVRVNYSEGCNLTKPKVERLAKEDDRITEAVVACCNSQITVLCLGLDETVEGEMHDDGNGGWAGDKKDVRLPACQRTLLRAVVQTGKPIIVILLSGGSLDPEIEAYENVRALVQGWYPGQSGGTAMAHLLFGEFSPSGRLPVTFYKASNTLPEFTDYSMKNRTYRYLEETPLYPFGFGLSYTSFSYADLACTQGLLGEVIVSYTIQNTGEREGREIVQIYCTIDHPDAPLWPSLCSFSSIHLAKGEAKRFHTVLQPSCFTLVNDQGERNSASGLWSIFVGGNQSETRSLELTKKAVLSTTVRRV